MTSYTTVLLPRHVLGSLHIIKVSSTHLIKMKRAALGFLSLCVFVSWLLKPHYDVACDVQVGDPNGPYPSPFSDIYRYMALIAVEGFDALPQYCGTLVGAFFAAGKYEPHPVCVDEPNSCGTHNTECKCLHTGSTRHAGVFTCIAPSQFCSIHTYCQASCCRNSSTATCAKACSQYLPCDAEPAPWTFASSAALQQKVNLLRAYIETAADTSTLQSMSLLWCVLSCQL